MLMRGSIWPGRSLERKSLKWKCYDKVMDCFLSCAVCFLLAAEGKIELRQEWQRPPLSESPGLPEMQAKVAQGRKRECGVTGEPGQAEGRGRGPAWQGVQQLPAEDAWSVLQGWPLGLCTCHPFA